ncbi:MAG: ATP-binding protein [Planctomycetota bacterium]
MFAQLLLRLTGQMDQLRLVWQTGETLLESVPFQEDAEGTRYHVLLALQEMVTNVLRHAYELDETLPIEVQFTVTGDSFEVELRDQGPEFDPLEHDTGGLGLVEQMPAEAGGYGIYIARMVMDEVVYARRDGWNTLRMKKLAGASSQSRIG